MSNDVEQIYCGGQEELPRLGLHRSSSRALLRGNEAIESEKGHKVKQ